MSAGDFIRSKYETDSGEICNIRVQPETLAATFGGTANAAPAGTVTQLASAIARKGKRQIGVGPRLIGVGFETPPTGYTSEVLYVPIMQKTLYDATALGDAVSYLGGTGVVVSKIAESIR